MDFQIRRITLNDIQGFHKCLDSVAKEGKFIAKESAPDIKRIEAFIGDSVRNNYPQFVAIDKNEIIGWCDAMPFQTKSLKHRAELGMGIIKEHRGKGIGEKLVLATLDHARQIGIIRIDLEVRADNERAIRLYRKTGFKEYGRRRMGIFLEGMFHDLILMEHIEE
jgi:RimJ/RimL family protein N-acetyltransferase